MGNNVFQSPFNITSAAIVAALGYAPANRSGETFTGAVTFNQGITVNAGAGAIVFNNSFSAPTGGYIGWGSHGLIRSMASGVFKLSNNAETDFDRLQFGGATSSFPAIKRYPSAPLFQFRTADDSAFVGVELKHVRIVSHTVATIGGALGAGAGSLFYVTDATTTTRQSVVAGGGSNKVLVYSDGTNWLIV
ncbi:hypothetical protein [Reyranella sp.]|uniref:hypothetical protein n=1 Tax=Reyranella sp. TaxID=1929291 RepID=UPI0027302020|nr:hypothetical protein [Reyranella sp.]MDP2376408.1 hypothetical protein [Reyranella sp.]